MSYCRAPVSRPGPPLRSGWLRVGLARGRTADAEAGGPGGGRGAGRWRAGHRSGSAPRHAQGCAARTSRTATAVWQAARAVGWARRASVAGTTRAGRQEAHARAGRSTGAGWRAAWGQRAPPPLAGRCAPLLDTWSFTTGLCAADTGAVEGSPWPERVSAASGLGRSAGAAPLACGWPLRFSVLERPRNIISGRSCVKARPRSARCYAALTPAPSD